MYPKKINFDIGGSNGKFAITFPMYVISPSEVDIIPFTVGKSAPT